MSDLEEIKRLAEQLNRAIQQLEADRATRVDIHEFGRVFRSMRKARHITVLESADLAGVSAKTINKLENSESPTAARLDTLLQLADVVGLQICLRR
jgi:DNA-binding XRE family transcriptional regulator